MARRFLVLNVISPLFVLLAISCGPGTHKQEALKEALIESPTSEPTNSDAENEDPPSATMEDFIGLWLGESGRDTLNILASESGVSLRWTSTLDGSRPRFIDCKVNEGKLIGDHFGHTGNVSVIYEEGQINFSIDPFAEFEPIRDMAFMKVVPIKKAIYIKPNEDLIYSFDTEDGHHLSLAKASDDTYLVYRYGTKTKIQMEFPNHLQGSWSRFSYFYFLRGGGAENEGLDENILRFDLGDFSYEVHDTYYAPEDSYYSALTVTNERTGDQEETKGRPETRKGSLMALRDFEQLKEDSDENIAWLSQDKKEEAPDDSLMQQESLGELRYHMRPSQVKEQVGLPDRIEVDENAPIDGRTYSYWYYDALGLKVELVSDDAETKNAKVEVIIIQGESPLVTDRWIGIGSTRSEVIETYSKELGSHQDDSPHKSMPGIPDVLIIGELGGMRFKFKADRVTEIVLGRLIGC